MLPAKCKAFPPAHGSVTGGSELSSVQISWVDLFRTCFSWQLEQEQEVENKSGGSEKVSFCLLNCHKWKEDSSSLSLSLLNAESVYGAVPAGFSRHDAGGYQTRCHRMFQVEPSNQRVTPAPFNSPPKRKRGTWLIRYCDNFPKNVANKAVMRPFNLHRPASVHRQIPQNKTSRSFSIRADCF